jgi:hypothetical protein
MIGRELGDPKHIKWMSCANKGMNIRSTLQRKTLKFRRDDN